MGWRLYFCSNNPVLFNKGWLIWTVTLKPKSVKNIQNVLKVRFPSPSSGDAQESPCEPETCFESFKIRIVLRFRLVGNVPLKDSLNPYFRIVPSSSWQQQEDPEGILPDLPKPFSAWTLSRTSCPITADFPL